MLVARMNRCSPSAAAFPYRAFPRNIDQIVESVFNQFPAAAKAAPPINVWEDSESITLEAELPGFAIEDLDITFADSELTISGERKHLSPDGAAFVRRERPTGRFTRSLRIPTDIAADKVTATLKDGVLTITLPKAPEVKPRKITVTTK